MREPDEDEPPDGASDSGLRVGDRVEVRDSTDKEDVWKKGVVTEIMKSGRPKVKRDGFQQAFRWDEVRPIKPREPEPEPEPQPQPQPQPEPEPDMEEGVPPTQP